MSEPETDLLDDLERFRDAFYAKAWGDLQPPPKGEYEQRIMGEPFEAVANLLWLLGDQPPGARMQVLWELLAENAALQAKIDSYRKTLAEVRRIVDSDDKSG